MIGSLRGRIATKTPPQLMIDVGGVGYELEAPMSTFFHLPAIGQEVSLLTHLVVREDAQMLYGFATQDERRLFRNLLKVSGVGPKIALALLSGISVEAFAQCILSEDVAALIRVPGIGRKTAERLFVEMRDRVAHLEVGAGMTRSAHWARLQARRSRPFAEGRRARCAHDRGPDPPCAAGRRARVGGDAHDASRTGH